MGTRYLCNFSVNLKMFFKIVFFQKRGNKGYVGGAKRRQLLKSWSLSSPGSWRLSRGSFEGTCFPPTGFLYLPV